VNNANERELQGMVTIPI